MIALHSRLRHKDGILKQEAEGVFVLLCLEGGQYYSLNEVGSRVWELCDGASPVSEIISTICEEFDAPAATIQADVLELLADLQNEKLVVENL